MQRTIPMNSCDRPVPTADRASSYEYVAGIVWRERRFAFTACTSSWIPSTMSAASIAAQSPLGKNKRPKSSLDDVVTALVERHPGLSKSRLMDGVKVDKARTILCARNTRLCPVSLHTFAACKRLARCLRSALDEPACNRGSMFVSFSPSVVRAGQAHLHRQPYLLFLAGGSFHRSQ